jgi:putative ABC transport system substrate-binding protein
MEQKPWMQWLNSSSDNRKSKIQNLKWAGFSVIAFVLVVAGAVAQAQQPKKIHRIGVLAEGSPQGYGLRIGAFLQGLRELGYAEGKNITIEYRFAEGRRERHADLAAQLVRLKVDVIVAAGGTGVALALKEATSTIPIVMAHGGDPVARGIIASLARPGGNITGLTSISPELAGKRLELLKETVPRLTRVGVLWDPAGQGAAAVVKETEVAARGMGVQVQSLEVRSPEDFEDVFKAATIGRSQALIITGTPVTTTYGTRIVELATRSRLPTMSTQSQLVGTSGLMSYGPSLPDLYRRSATYVDKILKGAKPADLPVERPMKFEFVINLKAAKQIGLTIPPNVLARADKVIK